MNSVISVAGPLCNTVEDVKLYCEGLWSEDFFKNNATVPPMAFRHKEYNETLGKKLRLGYLCWKDSNGVERWGIEHSPVSVATTRTMEMVKAKLRELGHELVPFTITLAEYRDLFDTYAGLSTFCSVPGMWHLQDNCYEYLLPSYRILVFIAKFPNIIKRFLSWFLLKFTKEQRLAYKLWGTRKRDYVGLNKMYQSREIWKDMIDKRWKEKGIDALISPCQYHAAFKNEFIDLGQVHDYYLMWNFTHFPAGCVPVSTVREDEAKGTYIKDTQYRWKDK